MIDVTELFGDPDFSENFKIWRKTQGVRNEIGEFEQGETSFDMYAPVQPARMNEIQMIPEGNRQIGMMAFWVKDFEVSMGGNLTTADELEWRGKRYSVIQVIPWTSYGWNKAFCVLKGGGL